MGEITQPQAPWGVQWHPQPAELSGHPPGLYHLWLLAAVLSTVFPISGYLYFNLQVLVGEVIEPRLREVFSSIPNLAYCLGILLVNILGCWLPWAMVAVLSTVLPISGMLMLLTLPESPVWLVNRGRADKARKSLMYLRGGDEKKVSSRQSSWTCGFCKKRQRDHDLYSWGNERS